MSLLSGATGALGFGGGLGSGGNGQGDSTSATSTLQQTIEPKNDIVSGAGARGAVTINTAFPGARLSATTDNINPPTEASPLKLTLIAGGFVALLAFIVIIGNR